MVKNNFRAVLTIFGKDKLLELRFSGLNGEKTCVKSIPNVNYRHEVNTEDFVVVFKNLIDALKNYDMQITGRYIIGKMLGLI